MAHRSEAHDAARAAFLGARGGDDVQVFPEDNVDALEESIRVRVLGRDLRLTLLMQEDELAPLFSGAAWAGTLLWDAAVYLTRHLLAEFQAQLPSARVIELGAGMYAPVSTSGVPGMAARVAGARNVVLTEQDELLRLMDVNLRANASALVGVRAGNIVARPLSWGEAQTRAYLDEFADEPVDVVLSCDCIYEPLYGESWRDLARTMEIICARYPRCVVLMGVERRNQDGIDKFLAFVDEHTTLQCELHERAEGTTNNRLELYYLKVATA